MPVDSEQIRERLNWLVLEKKIPVVTFNSDIVGTKSCFVGMDNNTRPELQQELFEMLTRGKGKIINITGYFMTF